MRAEVTKQHRQQPDDDDGRLGLQVGCLRAAQRSYKLSQADGRRHEFRQAGNTQYVELRSTTIVSNRLHYISLLP